MYRKNRLRMVVFAAILVMLLPLIAACGGEEGGETPAAATATPTTEAPSGGAETPAAEETTPPTETEEVASPTAEVSPTAGGSPAAESCEFDPALVDAATKEGVVVWYASMTTEDLDATVKEFESQFPDIDVQELRLSADDIPPRIATEMRSGQVLADVASGTAFQFQQLVNLGVIDQYQPHDPSEFAKGAVDPDGRWIALYNNTEVIAWNPQRLQELGLEPPQSWQDFTKPEWRGNFSIDPDSVDVYVGWIQALGEEQARQLLQGIAANQPMLREGHTLNAELVEAGEVPASMSVYGYKAYRDKQNGLPIDFANPDPFIVHNTPVGVIKDAQHPQAARLLMNWLTSRCGQQFIADVSGRQSPRLDVANIPEVLDPSDPNAVYVDPTFAENLDMYTEEFNQILGIR